MGKTAVVLICFSCMFAQSYSCCPRTFGTALVLYNITTYIKVFEECIFISDVQYSVSTVNDVKAFRFVISSRCISQFKLNVLYNLVNSDIMT